MHGRGSLLECHGRSCRQVFGPAHFTLSRDGESRVTRSNEVSGAEADGASWVPVQFPPSLQLRFLLIEKGTVRSAWTVVIFL
jgi:hypothetical protein